jgi:hypothetical protein
MKLKINRNRNLFKLKKGFRKNKAWGQNNIIMQSSRKE